MEGQNLKCTHAHEIHYPEDKREVSRSNLRELHFTQLTLLGEWIGYPQSDKEKEYGRWKARL
jgi:hypothetical protein